MIKRDPCGRKARLFLNFMFLVWLWFQSPAIFMWVKVAGDFACACHAILALQVAQATCFSWLLIMFLACGHEKRKNINVVEGLACECHANLELKSSQQRTQAKFSMDKPLSLPMPPPHCTLQGARYALHLAQSTISSMKFQQRRSQAMLRKENTFRFLGFLYFCDGFAWKATKMPGSWHFLCKSHDISEVKFSQQRSPAKFRWTNPLWNHAKLKLFYSVECLVLDRPCFCMLLLYFFDFATSILLKTFFFCPLYKRTICNPSP